MHVAKTEEKAKQKAEDKANRVGRGLGNGPNSRNLKDSEARRAGGKIVGLGGLEI